MEDQSSMLQRMTWNKMKVVMFVYSWTQPILCKVFTASWWHGKDIPDSVLENYDIVWEFMAKFRKNYRLFKKWTLIHGTFPSL
jgi:hypothetical protein